MIRNFFISSIRSLWRNKVFSTINILGLSIGISASLVIFLIVHHELSHDKFQKDGDRIFHVVLDASFNGQEGHSSAVPAPLSTAVHREVTGLDEVVPVLQFQGDATARVAVTRANDKLVVFKKQPNIVFTNGEYFQLISFKWLAGSKDVALNDPFSVVLTASRARQYFPDTDPTDIIGKTINYNDGTIVANVSGIVEDLNELTSFTAVEFISYASIAKTSLHEQFMMDEWNDWMAYSQLWIKLSDKQDVKKVQDQMNTLYRKHNKKLAENPNNKISFALQPLSEVHFDNKYSGFGMRVVKLSTLYGLLAIAIFLLLLGCINFINLTTAYASQRAKEIGIRKTIGSSKSQLVFQFLGETFVLTTIATLFSVAITPFLLKMFESFMPPGLKMNIFEKPLLLVFLFLLTLIVSLFSGIYPAFILTKFKPVLVLKNQAFAGSPQTRRVWIRKTLTISQFVIAQFFIIATVAVSQQINFAVNSDMGFKSESVFTFIQPRDSSKAHTQQLLNEIKNIPGVAIASTGYFSPADEGAAFGNISFFNGEKEIKPEFNIQLRWGSPDYISLYGIKLVAGRNVLPADTLKEFLVNESFAKSMGYKNPEDILNKNVRWNQKVAPVVGVMKDFHDMSMRSAITPLIFGGREGNFFHIKLAKNSEDGMLWKNALASTEKAFHTIYPEEEFKYSFVDDRIAGFYKSEKDTADLLKWATILSILISCMGLLGLVIYTTTIRTKEIGVRKILGATVADIVRILSKEFIWLVMISFLIATPIAWYVTHDWLQDYVYRYDMKWWTFAICGFGMLVIVLITLSINILKTAMGNPAKSLRTD